MGMQKKLMINTEPFNAGRIECQQDKLLAPSTPEFYIWLRSECTAKPNQGFEFVRWQENLNGNSTQFVTIFSPINHMGLYFRFSAYED